MNKSMNDYLAGPPAVSGTDFVHALREARGRPPSPRRAAPVKTKLL
jgi:hypothetical protein